VKRILIAEDEEDIMFLLSTCLRMRGYDTFPVSNGAEAVAAFCRERERGRPFDLLLFDISMPRMDGDAAALAVRFLDERVPILFLTGYGREAEGRPRMALLNHSGVLMKPVELGVLVERVERALGEVPCATTETQPCSS
jgi:CheY-like chemotaxis protein